MTLQITKYAISTNDQVYGSSNIMQVPGPQSGDRETLAVGAVQNTSPFETAMLARLYPTVACVIRIGVDAIAAPATGETIAPAPDGIYRYVPAGARISVIAP